MQQTLIMQALEQKAKNSVKDVSKFQAALTVEDDSMIQKLFEQ